MSGLDRAQVRDLLLRHTTAILFIAIFLAFGLQAPRFFEPESVANIVKQASFTGVVAVGMTFVLLTGGIDLSVGSNMYLSAMAAGYLLQVPELQSDVGVILAIGAAMVAGVVFGLVMPSAS
jgi:ribose/xylose/arabinose/galactoside ABC-type transport system permease subunit